MQPEPMRGEAAEFDWHVARRLGEIEGEARANALRALALVAGYGLELLAYHAVPLGPLTLTYPRSAEAHLSISLLAAVWALLCLGVHSALRLQVAPPALKYVVTAADLALLTGVLAVGEGPTSPFAVAYLLVVALAGLRQSLPLVRCATGGAIACYVALLGIARANDQAAPPRYHQCVLVLAVLLLGLMLGQGIRRARRMAETYARRQRDRTEPSP